MTHIFLPILLALLITWGLLIIRSALCLRGRGPGPIRLPSEVLLTKEGPTQLRTLHSALCTSHLLRRQILYALEHRAEIRNGQTAPSDH